MELCIAIAEGIEWLGFKVRKGRVLYVNLEIDKPSCLNRFKNIYEALKIPIKHPENLSIWNLRGRAVPLDKLAPKLIRRVKDQHYDAIIIDPIYKVITGDENSASEMGAFCNLFDKVATETGCCVIYCHHHSKGTQGQKRAIDRASGSGVFARDPDAQLDMIELELSDDIKNNVREPGATAWRLEGSLREFPNFKPVNCWFEYPIHRVDKKSVLEPMPAQGTWAAGQIKNTRSKSNDQAAVEFRNAYDALNIDGNVSVQDMTQYLGISDKAIYARLKRMQGEFVLEKGKIILFNSKVEK
jgi:RecA-family ATPase